MLLMYTLCKHNAKAIRRVCRCAPASRTAKDCPKVSSQLGKYIYQ